MRSLLLYALLVACSTGAVTAQSNPGDATAEPAVEISALAERPAQVGPAEFFTGTALVRPLFDPAAARSFGGAAVIFFPGARTHWHTHLAGQTLVVTEGVGWVQTRGGERREIRAGDVVWTPPGVAHWHGATSGQSMTHTSLQGAVDGAVVVWLAPVTDAEYLGTDE